MLIISLVIAFPPLENEAATDPKNFMLVLISEPVHFKTNSKYYLGHCNC